VATTTWADLMKSADDAGFSNTPPGTYDATVFSAEAKTTSNGKDQVVVRFQIVGGPNGGRKTAPRNLVVSPENPNALGFFFRDMRSLGLGNDFFAKEPSMQAIAAALVGRPCRIEVGTRVWNNEEREDIKRIMPSAPGGASVPVAPVAMPQPVVPQPVMPQPAADVPQTLAMVAADPSAPKLPF
jgi:hypothetical protein